MLRIVLASFAFSLLSLACGPSPLNTAEGEGEGSSAGEGEGSSAGEGEGSSAGEGEGAVGEGEGSAGEGEGEGASERTFTCQDSSTVTSQTSCSSDEECAIGQIMLDCCGSLQVTGVNVGDICSFGPAAGACFQATCDCAAQPNVADDGTHAADAQATPILSCVNHVCTTTYGG